MNLLCRGSGQPVLFIHGMPTCSQLWNGVIDRLYEGFTCYTIDLPGLGKRPGEPYQTGYLHRLAQRIDKLRIENNIEKWHVVGHDAGSAVAVHYAHAFQEHVSSLVLLAPALFPELKPYYLLEFLRKPVIGECLAPLLKTIFWKVAMRLASQDEEGKPNPSTAAFQEPFSGLEGSWKFMRVLRWGRPCDVLAEIPEFLPRLTIPTLILYGSRDIAIPAAFARRASALIPSSQLMQVDSGHFIPLNRPGFLAANLRSFFGAQAH